MVITFKENPICVITMRDIRIEVGMELPTIRDALKSPKNTKMIAMDISTAKTMVTATSCRDSKIESASSLATRISRSLSLALRASMASFTSSERAMAVECCCFVIEREMVS